MRYIIPISGKDSLACAFIQTTRYPDLPYEFMFTDVGAELPETYEWLDSVERKTGWSIHRIGENLPARIHSYSGFLPGPKSRYCTRETKIEPMQSWLKGDDAIIYYGLRADEVRKGYVPVAGSRIIPAYPLQDAGIDLNGVYAILEAQDLLPPTFFWQSVFDGVCERLGGDPSYRLSRTEKLVLFSGRTRANCFFCFFQRQYEFVWLYETHYDLYAKARDMERAEYTFQPGFRLADLEDPIRRRTIIDRRVKEVATYIVATAQEGLFPPELVGETELALTSCGLLCGK